MRPRYRRDTTTARTDAHTLAHVFRYRLHLSDGTDLGEAAYAMQIQVGETIHIGTPRYRVVRVVDFSEDDASPLTGMLEVEPV